MSEENDIIRQEQESIKKNQEQLAKEAEKKEQARLAGDRQREEQRLADERAKDSQQNQEKLQKESEQRRKAQNERKEQLKRLEEVKKQREQEIADREVGGGTGEHGREIEQHLAKGRQLDIRANKEGRGAKQEQSYKAQEQSSGLDKLRAFEKSVQGKVEEKLQERDRTQELSRTR